MAWVSLEISFSNVNRFGGGLTETVAGPVTDVGKDLINLTIGNLYEVAQGEDTKAAKEFIDFTLRYTPGKFFMVFEVSFRKNSC